MSTTAVDAAHLTEWLESHHKGSKTRSGDTAHIYGPPIYGASNINRWDLLVEMPLWRITWILNGSIDVSSLNINAIFSVRIPTLGTLKLSDVKGNLNDGVLTEFRISGNLNGTAKFYFSNQWLFVHLLVTVFGSSFGPASIQFIPFP